MLDLAFCVLAVIGGMTTALGLYLAWDLVVDQIGDYIQMKKDVRRWGNKIYELEVETSTLSARLSEAEKFVTRKDNSG